MHRSDGRYSNKNVGAGLSSPRRQVSRWFRFLPKWEGLVALLFFLSLGRLLRQVFFNHSLSCAEARDGYAVRRGADVVHADLMAELHAVEVAAVFTADADLEFIPRTTALFDAPLDEHADALGVERLERIGCEDAGFLFVNVVGQEAARVVSREAHRGLCEVVGAEGEELGAFRDLVGEQRGARELDHGADDVVELGAGLLDDLVGDAASGVLENRELLFVE